MEQVLREPSIRQLSLTLATSSSSRRDQVYYESFSLVPPHDLEYLKVATAEQCHIEIGDILDIYPCTPLQAGIMTLAARSSEVYVCNFSFPIPQNVKVDRLRSAWESLVLATPLLRNRLVHHNRGVEFYQVTAGYHPTSWDDDDKSFGSSMMFGSNLCRSRVIRDKSKQGWKFVLKIHHALCDGSTIDRILLGLQEMYYRTNVTDNSVPITTGTPFTEYIRYLVRDIENHEAEHVSFWSDRLANTSITPFPSVPLTRVVEHTATHKVLCRNMSTDVSATAQKYDVSATTVIQTAWAVVLGKHTAPITVPCRVQWDEAVSIRQLMQRLYREYIDMIPHQHYGLQNISAIGPTEKNACLFRTLLIVQPGKADITPSEGFLQAEDSSGKNIISTYPITVELTLPGKGMSSAEVEILYNESLLTTEMAERVLRNLEAALNCIGSADFSTLVSDIKIIGVDEGQLLVPAERKCPEKIDRCLHSLAEDTAGKYQNMVAGSAMVEFVESQRQPDGTTTQFEADIGEKRMITIPSMGQGNGVASRPPLDEVANILDIGPDSIEDIYPCTPFQEGIMFLSERNKGSYHACLSLLMPRRLELDRLYKAFRALIEMHDILRTRYVFHKKLGSIQVVMTASAHFRDADRRKSQNEEGPPEFAYGLPLHQHNLVTRDDGVYLKLDCHHSIYDGWSLPLMLDDLRCLYRDVSYLPKPLPRPFKDVVAYINDPATVQAADEFWKGVLQGVVISDFPEMNGRTIESIQATAYIKHSFPLNRDPGVQDMSIATLVTAAWSFVVSNYTGSEDVCFELLLSRRDVPIDGIERVRGPTINTVPFRIALQRRSATVADLLESIQVRTLDMIPHQFTSLIKLHKLFSDGRGDFGSLLSTQTGASLIDEAVAVKSHEFEISMAADGGNTLPIFGEPYPLFIGVTVDQAGDHVSIGAQYDSTVVSTAHVNRALAQLEVAFHQLAKIELRDRLLSDITLLSESDKKCLLDWAGPPIEPGDACVHEMIEKLATEHPHRQALEGFTESLTYAQLNQQANSLAAHVLQLTQTKIRRGATILIWMETSPRAVVAILAVLKPGASYVPLDHRLPLARAEYIVRDVGSHIMLASRNLFEQAVKLEASLKSQQVILNIIQVDEAIKTMKLLHEPRSCVIGSHLEAVMSDLAYVIYTSGSTGKPKGVMMEHQALSATVKEQAIAYRFNSATRMFSLASLSCDLSLLEVFAVLCHGGCLCIPTEDERSSSHDLVSSINRHRANHISTPPAVASLIDLRCTPTIEVIALGGEVLREENIVNAQEAGVRLFNAYGPSEACIDAIVHRNVVPGVSVQNIGTPMSSQVWIVDPADPRRQVPPGCIGELALSGTLARGYLNDAAKTAEVFLTDCPFALLVYLTGDLGRHEPDGSIYFLGRKDQQVKLNGQRVELGDIESAVKTFYPHHNVVVDFFSSSSDDKKSLVVFLATFDNSSSLVPICVESRMQSDTREFQRLQTQLKT